MTSDELYKRILSFAKSNNKLLKSINMHIYNKDYISQLLRSSSSIGANYIEAIEAISKKDFIHRLRICRKETRESIHWLILIQDAYKANTEVHNTINVLIKEAHEFVKIFTASILTAEKNQKMNQ